MFSAALSRHPVPPTAVGECAGEILDAFGGAAVDLVVCFASPHLAGAMDDIAAALTDLLHPRAMIGATAVAVVGGGEEIEEGPGLSVFAASLPDARLAPVRAEAQLPVDGDVAVDWSALPEWATPDQPATLLLVSEPYSFPPDVFLGNLAQARPEITVIGGIASVPSRGTNRLVLDGAVLEDGAAGVLVGGVDVETVVSQGCRPVGTPYVATRTERNVVVELAGQPALSRLQQCAEESSDDERELMRNGLHVGLVIDERKARFGRGDFLVRNLVGADRQRGAIAVGDQVEVGQTVQFHVRDASTADEDLRSMLAGRGARGALMFTCNGRGRHLFGVPDHDAGVLQELLGPIPAAGAFCNGEFGPVGGRNFLHGYTASIALFGAHGPVAAAEGP
jgi:small ligand-binding sensory domain FIST